MKLLVFLQCAWRPGAVFKSRDDWLAALWKSYSGKRLREMLPDNIDVFIDNSTPKVGDSADDVFPPDLEYMKDIIEKVKPDKILACGRVAQTGLDRLEMNYIPAPHPAYRALSKEMTRVIRNTILC